MVNWWLTLLSLFVFFCCLRFVSGAGGNGRLGYGDELAIGNTNDRIPSIMGNIPLRLNTPVTQARVALWLGAITFEMISNFHYLVRLLLARRLRVQYMVEVNVPDEF